MKHNETIHAHNLSSAAQVQWLCGYIKIEYILFLYVRQNYIKAPGVHSTVTFAMAIGSLLWLITGIHFDDNELHSTTGDAVV